MAKMMSSEKSKATPSLEGVDIVLPDNLPGDSVDIPLDFSAPNESIAASEQSPNTERTKSLREQIHDAATIQMEYVSMIALYRDLQDATKTVALPDFRRVSAQIPPVLREKIAQFVPEFKKLSLFSATDAKAIGDGLESMIRNDAFEDAVDRVEQNRAVARIRLEQLQAKERVSLQEGSGAVASSVVSDEERAAAIVASLKEKGEWRSMPPVSNDEHFVSTPEENAAGFWGRMRRVFEKK